MPTVPYPVRKFADSIPHPVALVGCRMTEMSLDCCEYDLAVFAPGENRVVQIGSEVVELVHFAGPIKNYLVELNGMQLLKEKSLVTSDLRDVSSTKYRKALVAAGKKSLISSLFCQQEMKGAKHPAVAAMWLKIAAYELIDGMLALSGSRSMPIHALQQIRQVGSAGIADGLEAALECIGIERATRPAISRSIGATKELKSRDYDRDLFASKIDYLLRQSMLADSYYYVGRVAAKNLVRRKESFHSRYGKLVQLALDLSNDFEHLETLQRRMFKAVNSGLKS